MSTTLWNFALGLYARPGIEQACLRLQDEHGEDVCLLLCGAWLGERGAACTPARCLQLREIAADWQREVITPLRELRRRWKTMAGEDTGLVVLRQRLATLEQDAERELLQRLEVLGASWPDRESGATPHWLTALSSPTTNAAALASLAAAVRGETY